MILDKEKYNIQEISELIGIKVNSVHFRVNALGIIPKFVKHKLYFDKMQTEKIINYENSIKAKKSNTMLYAERCVSFDIYGVFDSLVNHIRLEDCKI